MSYIRLTVKESGDAISSADLNSNITHWHTHRVDADNVRIEGIDRRNLGSAVVIDTVSLNTPFAYSSEHDHYHKSTVPKMVRLSPSFSSYTGNPVYVKVPQFSASNGEKLLLHCSFGFRAKRFKSPDGLQNIAVYCFRLAHTVQASGAGGIPLPGTMRKVGLGLHAQNVNQWSPRLDGSLSISTMFEEIDNWDALPRYFVLEAWDDSNQNRGIIIDNINFVWRRIKK